MPDISNQVSGQTPNQANAEPDAPEAQCSLAPRFSVAPRMITVPLLYD